jgi:hypothetical protein
MSHQGAESDDRATRHSGSEGFQVAGYPPGNNSPTLVYTSKWFRRVLGYFVTRFQLSLLSFYKSKEIADLIKSTRKEVDLVFFPYEAFVVYSIAKSQSRLMGEMAEVGVYQGGSAKLICEAKGERKLHLFDTFEGLPRVSEKDTHFGMRFWSDKGFSNTSLGSVSNLLQGYNDVYLYKGKFPETSAPIRNSKFSFVHLDVDLYESTLDCLKFFYPRLIKGGIILTHDYHTNGVQSAFKEFFQEEHIPIIELNGSQCMIVNTE